MVRFNPKARLDRSRIRERGRGSSAGGLGGAGMRLPIPSGAAGGGCGSIVLLVVIVGVMLLVQQCGGVNIPVLPGGTDEAGSGADTSQRYGECESGEDANASQDCARVAVENSLTDYWEGELGDRFEAISAINTFSGSVGTECGNAGSDVGPFYCPADRGIYLDTTFFDTVLEQQLGGPDGGFVEFYVLAHEYGHHISNLLGFMGQVQTQQGATSDATRLELQADCYAGMWVRHATSTEDEGGEGLISDITTEDIRLSQEAAAAVGDDAIQRKTGGQVNPETWNHGSSEQRMHWFDVGYEQGELDACDTFAASESEVLGQG
ncbi:MAG TPA: neutral zinc metallopeptidase [Nocardioides sp.]|nr:neutral zinc metallopeptidase [Nocardioides sp.]